VNSHNQQETELTRSQILLSSSYARAGFGCVDDDSRRILDLEIENARLQQLVAELLVKNQELRQLINQSNTERSARLIESV
jgi:Skp family chaperone for outer membrane proteins